MGMDDGCGQWPTEDDVLWMVICMMGYAEVRYCKGARDGNWMPYEVYFRITSDDVRWTILIYDLDADDGLCMVDNVFCMMPGWMIMMTADG